MTEDDDLWISPPMKRLTPAQTSWLKRNKAKIIKELEAEQRNMSYRLMTDELLSLDAEEASEYDALFPENTMRELVRSEWNDVIKSIERTGIVRALEDEDP
ncbi:MAG: hypothetical protein ACREVK_12325 [Gammaproteobacteria bacterium]